MSLRPPTITASLAGSKDEGEVLFNKAKSGLITIVSPTAADAGAAFFQKDDFVSTGANAMQIIF
jgi:hypothetical protein